MAESAERNGSIRSPGPPLPCLQTHQEGLTASEQRGKHPGLGENTPHTPPPPPRTRLTAGTDWLLHLYCPAARRLPHCRRSPCKPPALCSSHLAPDRVPQRGDAAVLAVVVVTTFPTSIPSPSPIFPGYGAASCSPAPLKRLNSRSQEH